MAVLISDVWHSTVIDFGCVTSRTLWIKAKFSKVVMGIDCDGRLSGLVSERERERE